MVLSLFSRILKEVSGHLFIFKFVILSEVYEVEKSQKIAKETVCKLQRYFDFAQHEQREDT